jgi:hypothetical protein
MKHINVNPKIRLYNKIFRQVKKNKLKYLKDCEDNQNKRNLSLKISFSYYKILNSNETLFLRVGFF